MISYTYNNNGQVATMTDPNGGVTTYKYDLLNRLVRMQNPAGEITRWTYDAMGRRLQMIFSNGVTTTYAYDNAYRLTTLVTVNKMGELLSAYTYSFDKVGNRLSMTEIINGGNSLTTSYQYDDFYRLAHINYPKNPDQGYPEDETFSYDMVGNRVSLIKEESGQIDYSYNWADMLKTIRGYENFDFTFDPNGNQVEKHNIDSDTSTLYSYNFDNMLTHVQGPGFDNSIAYDVQGKRWSLTQTNNEKIHYVYDREDVLIEYGENLNLQCSYTNGPLIDEPISQTRLYTDSDPTWKTQYFHRDGLGSVTLVSGSLGDYQASYAYSAFGELNNQISYFNQVTNSYTYTGRNLDFESNLYNYRSRMYDAGIGRFLTQDSFAGYETVPPSLHKYSYVHNNPVNLVDSMGLAFPVIGIISIIANLLVIFGGIAWYFDGICGYLETIQDIIFGASIIVGAILLAQALDGMSFAFGVAMTVIGLVYFIMDIGAYWFGWNISSWIINAVGTVFDAAGALADWLLVAQLISMH